MKQDRETSSKRQRQEIILFEEVKQSTRPKMSTTKSIQGSSPRTDVFESYSPRSDSSREGGNQTTGKRLMLISTPESSQKTTPRTNNSSSVQEGSGSQGQRSDEQKITTIEVSSSVSSEFRDGVEEKISSDSSKTAVSLGEVREVEEEGVSTLLTDDKFLAENIETVLDGFEIFDPHERDEIRQSLADEHESSEAYEAVEKVSNVSQSSLKRLQRVVKEKDELIVALQAAVASAYRDAVGQQERDQEGLEKLHKMFLTRDGHTPLDLKDSLQEFESGNGLAGQLAKLFDQYLHELTIQHVVHTQALERDLASWKSRCEEMEHNLVHEKQHWQSHLSSKLTNTMLATSRRNQVLEWERAKDELQITHGMIAKLKEQLKEKDEQLRIYRESVQMVESLLAEEKARQTEMANDYEQITRDTRQTLGKVSAVNKQLRMLKTDTSNYYMQGHSNDLEVKQLQQKLELQNGMNRKLAVELAAYRRRSSTRPQENGCTGCKSLVETEKQVQLLRDCVAASVAQILELKDRLHTTGAETTPSNAAALKGFDESILSRDTGADGINSHHGFVLSNAKDTTCLDLNCSHDFVPASDEISDSNLNCCHDFVPSSDKGNRSGFQCHHTFVPVGNLDTYSDPHCQPEGGVICDKGLASYQLCCTGSPRTLVKNALRLVETETMKKLEGNTKITKKAELLQKKLENCKKAMETNDIELSKSGATIEQLKYELKKSHETNRELETKLRKRLENKNKNPADCVRIKGLLENIEKVEMESTLLKHEVMVQKDRQIARLERELHKLQSRPQHGISTLIDGAKRPEANNTWEKLISDLESTIVSKDSLILELRFEVDQATWKLDQVETRFDILFGALDCKKLEFNPPITDSILESIFSAEKFNLPALVLLKEKVLTRRGYFRSGSREKELAGLIEDLVKVVEKMNYDNEKLRRTCEDTVKHMEKNKELRKVVDDLQGQMEKDGRSSHRDKTNSVQLDLIADLKSRLSNLADANAGLVKALRDTEDQYSGLKQMVHEQLMEDNQDKEAFRKSRRICFSKDEHRKQDKRLQEQADKINILEEELATKGHLINDLHEELERKDDELDLIYGKLSIEMQSDQSENIKPSKKDLWSYSKTDARYRDSTKQAPEDYFDNEYLVEHDLELTQAENQRLRKFVTALKNPELLDEIRDLKSEYQRTTKVCDRYEELLRIYSRQIGVPFNSLRKRF